MASGNITGSTNVSSVQVRVKWEQKNTDTTARTTQISAALQVYNTGSVGMSGRGTWTLTIDGNTTTYSKVQMNFYRTAGWVTVGTALVTVTYGADGTKSAAVSATGGFLAEEGQPYTSTTLSGTAAMDPISTPSASTATCTQTVAINGSNACVVTISRSNAAYTHTVSCYINSTYILTQSNVGTSVSFTIPTSWLAAMPSSTSITGHVGVTTYNGSTQIGQTQTINFTLTVPENLKPTVASGWYSLSPVNTGLPSLWSDLYVKGYSKARATFNASKVTAPTGTSIAAYAITVAGTSYRSESNYTTAALGTAGTVAVMLSVSDARGRTTAEWINITVQDYSAPTMAISYVTRCLQDGTASSSGTYIKALVTASVSSVSGRNAGTLRARGKVGAGAYGAYVTMTSGTQMIFSGYQATQSATLEFSIADSVGNTSVQTRYVAAGEAPVVGPSLLGFNIRDGGTAAAFGKMADTDGWLQTNFVNGFHVVQGLLKLVGTTVSEAELKRMKSFADNTGMDETAYGDANAITSSGMYHIQQAISNTPTTYGILIVIRTGVPWIVQIYVAIDNPDVYWRTSNGGTSWIGWRKVTSVAV